MKNCVTKIGISLFLVCPSIALCTENSAKLLGKVTLNPVGNRVVINQGESSTITSEISGQTYAGTGAAIFNNSGTLTINDGVKFDSNFMNAPNSTGSSTAGGAIATYGETTIGNDVSFTNNTSNTQSGALFVKSNNNDGTLTTVNIGDNVNFTNNTAYLEAGALGITGHSSVTIGKNAVFIGNKTLGDGQGTPSGTGYGMGGAISVVTTNTEAEPAGLTIGEGASLKGNSANYGGAINIGDVNSTVVINANTIFESNSADVRGGAINNQGNLILDGLKGKIIFKNNSTDGLGGAIYNKAGGEIDIVGNTAFEGNGAETYGGAIYNLGDIKIGDNVQFIYNSADVQGGAIYNRSGGKIKIGDSVLFSKNIASSMGAVANIQGGEIAIGNNATFTDNKAAASDGAGGAIYNQNANLTIGDNATFANNSSGYSGGALYNESMNQSADAANVKIGDNATFLNNTSLSTGALYNYAAGVDNNDATIEVGKNASFIGNSATDAVRGKGGAVGNYTGKMTIGENSLFKDNSAKTNGGAIANITYGLNQSQGATLTLDGSGKFINNTAGGDGGAIYISKLDGSTSGQSTVNINATTGDFIFSGNSAGGKGGAIYNDGVLNLNAEGGDIIFANNTAGGKSNDIYNDNGIINVGGTHTTTLNGGIAGMGELIKKDSGILNLFGDNTEYTGKISLQDGVVNTSGASNPTFKDEVTITGEKTVMNVGGNSTFEGGLVVDKSTIGIFGHSDMQNLTIGSTINMIDGKAGLINVAAIPGVTGSGGLTTLNENVNYNLDISGRGGASDKLVTVDLVTNGNAFNVEEINLTQAPIDRSFAAKIVDVTGSTTGDLIINTNGKSIDTPIGRYAFSGSKGTGMLSGNLVAYNPSVFRGQVATVAQYANQLALNSILFDHVDIVTSDLLSDGNENRYASSEIQFSPYQYSKKDGGIWMKSYGNFEKIRMSQDLTVGNNAYGALVGADLPMKELKRGWGFVPTVYAAYNGAHQYYNGIGMYQNGGQVGAMGTFEKGDFINTILGYGGYYSNQMNVPSATDTVGNWFWGVANKSAYNVALTRELVLQPTFMMAFNQFGKQSWGTDYGQMGMQSGMLNGLNVAPGANLIWKKPNYSLYAMAQWMFNIDGGSSGQAGNVELPSVRMGTGYIEYGAGVTRQFKERFTTFAQGTIRNGTRNGVGVQAGLNWSI